MDTLTIPVIDNMTVIPQTTILAASMTLACIAVTVRGLYNIHTNCYYPSTVRIDGERLPLSLEDYCLQMDWDYSDTYEAIQVAVENR